MFVCSFKIVDPIAHYMVAGRGRGLSIHTRMRTKAAEVISAKRRGRLECVKMADVHSH